MLLGLETRDVFVNQENKLKFVFAGVVVVKDDLLIFFDVGIKDFLDVGVLVVDVVSFDLYHFSISFQAKHEFLSFNLSNLIRLCKSSLK